LYGSAIGGDLDESSEHIELTELDVSEVLDFMRRPANLADDTDAYALRIQGESMFPRFKHGERVGVSPKASVEIGDDVIVQLRGESDDRVRMVLVKELVRRTATHIELRQYNPLTTFRIERKKIVSIHKVKGHFL
jgi:phage repressor protein C with HTH and peptisase S24 domain